MQPESIVLYLPQNFVCSTKLEYLLLTDKYSWQGFIPTKKFYKAFLNVELLKLKQCSKYQIERYLSLNR